MHELSYMLVAACEEAVAEGRQCELDPAVAVIAGRINFASPTDVMSPEAWKQLVFICQHELRNSKIAFRDPTSST